MTQTKVLPVRVRARALAFVAPLLLAFGLAQACAQTKLPLGSDCIKSEDCLSGVCTALVCAAPGPTTSVEETAEAATSDAEAVEDTSTADTGSAPDTGTAPEAAPDGPAEAASGGD